MAIASKKTMIVIDGSYGEGGGQVLRTSLSLSCITGKPVKIHNIRSGRAEPGLKPQHLLSAHAAARITDGKLTGAELGSTQLAFFPGPVRPGDYTFDVAFLRSSAGSVGLVFQTIAPPLFFAPERSFIRIKGGTHVEWSPPADYIKEVFLPTISAMGVNAVFKNPLMGYYPLGGGEIEASIEPAKTPLTPLMITERGRILRIRVVSAVSNLPVTIAERQLNRVKALCRRQRPSLRIEGNLLEAPSRGRGTFVFILAEFENIRAGFSALGAPDKKAEAVADEATDKLLRYLKRPGAADRHLSDQILLFMALAEGESIVTASEVTNHLMTNIYVIEKLLPVRFELAGKAGEEGILKVHGIGFRRQG